ncbi:MAG: DNA polymerase III subunit alpha [Planctomycetota bacterium]|nr:DNA polymerase III subunit alpha [Planctomycetota bacterium]
MEAYIAPGGMPRTSRELADGESACHLLLLAKDIEGYRNLMRLSTAAYLEGHYYKPRVDRDLLAAHSKGLIATTGCMSSEFGRELERKGRDAARRLAGIYREIFGAENLYFEIQDHGLPEEKRLYGEVLALAREMGGKVVATNDVHYVEASDARAHDVLLCIGTGKMLQDENRMRFGSEEFYMKSGEQMAAMFAEICPEAVANTIEVAGRCDLKLKFGEYHYPKFEVPPGVTEEEYFRDLVFRGLKKRYGTITEEIRRRAEEELRVISKMGFTGYLLIVWDIVRYAREQGIPVGPGRGSATGSICCYALGITNLDPLKYGLIFERFINEGRNEMPDIDLDFCQARRGEMIGYVARKYGEQNVAQIITFGTLQPKASVRDVGRVLGWPLHEVDRIAKLVAQGSGETLREIIYSEPDLRNLYESDGRARELLELAASVEGLTRQAGTHAAGIVVADRPLIEYCPLYKDPKEGTVTTQFHMKLIDPIGLLKIDFLGLQTMTLIHKTIATIKARRGIEIDPDRIPLDDAATYAMLSRGESAGIFQFESDGMRRLLMEARPDRLEDLIFLNAMYRPGPINDIPRFINRKHGREEIHYLHPSLEPFLRETYGVIAYQEQVIQIAHELAGFSLSEADALRKAMGKKIASLMDRYHPMFVEGVMRKGLTREQAEELWARIEKFSGYGFNKSHAAAYALVAYQTAYLKCNYIPEFMASLLTLEMGDTDKVVEYIREARRMGIGIRPPDINASEAGFSVLDDHTLGYGLAAIKGVGEKAVESVVDARRKAGPFRDIYDFCERVDLRLVNKAVLEALICAGAFDGLAQGMRREEARARLLAVSEVAHAHGSATQRERAVGQGSLFADIPAPPPALPEVPPLPTSLMLQKEKERLGHYMSDHPLRDAAGMITAITRSTIRTVAAADEGAEVLVGGMLAAIQTRVTRDKGEKMAIVTIEDLEGSIEAVVFPRLYEACRDKIRPEAVVFVRGQVQRREQGVSIRSNDLFTPDEIYEAVSALTVTAPAVRFSKEVLEQTAAMLAASPGSCPVYLIVTTPDGTEIKARCGPSFRVRPTPKLAAGITALLGEGSVICGVDLQRRRPQGASRFRNNGTSAPRTPPI